MPSQYILASQITPLHTRRAVRVRLVRTYEVPELRGGITSKSKECLFHDEEKTVLNDFITGTVVISTLADLYMQTEGGDFYVPAIITGIETSGEWYYISCKSAGCNKKLKSDDKGLLFCEKCKRKWQKGVVRYKVVVRVAEAHSDAPFIMWDRECSELLGMPAAELIANYNEENGEVPTELETMIGKAMVFKINIKKENKHIYGSAFTVMRVLRDDGIVTAYCSSLAPDQERDLI
nr:uncharacterized protein LOC109179287 [Ipomoea trifida]